MSSSGIKRAAEDVNAQRAFKRRKTPFMSRLTLDMVPHIQFVEKGAKVTREDVLALPSGIWCIARPQDPFGRGGESFEIFALGEFAKGKTGEPGLRYRCPILTCVTYGRRFPVLRRKPLKRDRWYWHYGFSEKDIAKGYMRRFGGARILGAISIRMFMTDEDIEKAKAAMQ